MPPAPLPKPLMDWVRTFVVLAGTIGSVFLAYGKLDAKADTAIHDAKDAKEDADEARKDLGRVKDSLVPLREELVRIRTILDERLPHAVPSGVKPP